MRTEDVLPQQAYPAPAAMRPRPSLKTRVLDGELGGYVLLAPAVLILLRGPIIPGDFDRFVDFYRAIPSTDRVAAFALVNAVGGSESSEDCGLGDAQ